MMLSADDLCIIVKGLFHDGLDTERLTEIGRKELRAALEKCVELYKKRSDINADAQD